MAISIDRVYQKVLALANKEQRGYITPQEFNLFADIAQMEIFEQYFYDLNQAKRRGNDGGGSAGRDFSMIDKVEEKLNPFKKYSTVANSMDVSEYYKIREITCVNPYGDGRSFSVEEVYHGEQFRAIAQSSPLLRATITRPTFWIGDNKIYFLSGQTASTGSDMLSSFNFGCNYISKPTTPNWTYLIDPNIDSNALYNSDAIDLRDFELHASEEGKLVTKILQLAGINMKDYNLAQLAGQKEAGINQQEKQ